MRVEVLEGKERRANALTETETLEGEKRKVIFLFFVGISRFECKPNRK